jgi:hypothetical protein
MKPMNWMILTPLLFALAACSYIPNVVWKNETGIAFSVFVIEEEQFSLRPEEKSRQLRLWDGAQAGTWPVSVRAGACEYKYNKPDIYVLHRAAIDAVRTNKSKTSISPFVLVVDSQFVIHFQYPPDWKWQKPVIAGFPAVPRVTCN